MNHEPNISNTSLILEQSREGVESQQLTMHEIAINVLLDMAGELNGPSAAELKEAISHDDDIDELIAILETALPGFAETFDSRFAAALMQAEAHYAQARHEETQLELFGHKADPLVEHVV